MSPQRKLEYLWSVLHDIAITNCADLKEVQRWAKETCEDVDWKPDGRWWAFWR